MCTHMHWCFSYSSVWSVAQWQSSRWLMSRCGTSRNCAFSLLNKALEVPEKYSTSEFSSAEIDFNSLPALLKHPTAETWWCSQDREGKSYFSSGKTCGLCAKATVPSSSRSHHIGSVGLKGSIPWCLWLQCTQEDKVVAWTKEIHCHLILTLNSCAEAWSLLLSYRDKVTALQQQVRVAPGRPEGQVSSCSPCKAGSTRDWTVRVIDKHLHLYLHVWVHIYYTLTYIPTCLHTYLHTCIQMYILIYLRTCYLHVSAYLCTYVHV